MSTKAALKGKKGKKQDEEKEKEWMDYLKKHHFIDKFKDSVKEIFDKEPNITKDPVKYGKAVRKKRDKVVEDFVREELLFMFRLLEYGKVMTDAWKGTYGSCTCSGSGGAGVKKEPPIPAFLVRPIRPETPSKEEEAEEDLDEIESVDEEGDLKNDGSQAVAVKPSTTNEFEDTDDLLNREYILKSDDPKPISFDEKYDSFSEDAFEVEDKISSDKVEEEEDMDELDLADSQPCHCIDDFMTPFPLDEYNYVFNGDILEQSLQLD